MLKADIKGLDIVVSGLDQVNVDVREAAFYAVIEVMQKAFKACFHLLSESDHTLKDLAMMGHPYGFTHPATVHDPDVIVHYQDTMGGKEGPQKHYRDCLKADPPRGAFGDIIGGRIYNESDLDELIQGGSPTMRARPWMQWVVDNYGEDFADLLEARIQESISRLRLAS